MEYKVLALGDVASETGLQLLEKKLRAFKKEHDVRFTVVNGENISGSGLTRDQAQALFAAGAGALLFLGMKRVQMSGLRAYVLLGAAVGWFLYAASVSRFFRWTAEKIGNYRRKKETDNG